MTLSAAPAHNIAKEVMVKMQLARAMTFYVKTLSVNIRFRDTTGGSGISLEEAKGIN